MYFKNVIESSHMTNLKMWQLSYYGLMCQCKGLCTVRESIYPGKDFVWNFIIAIHIKPKSI